jgi:hypothetical protein
MFLWTANRPRFSVSCSRRKRTTSSWALRSRAARWRSARAGPAGAAWAAAGRGPRSCSGARSRSRAATSPAPPRSRGRDGPSLHSHVWSSRRRWPPGAGFPMNCPVRGDNRDTAGRPHQRSGRVRRRSAPRFALDEEQRRQPVLSQRLA